MKKWFREIALKQNFVDYPTLNSISLCIVGWADVEIKFISLQKFEIICFNKFLVHYTVRKVDEVLRFTQRIPVTQIEIEQKVKYLNSSSVALMRPPRPAPCHMA
jgi:hypothetical protein